MHRCASRSLEISFFLIGFISSFSLSIVFSPSLLQVLFYHFSFFPITRHQVKKFKKTMFIVGQHVTNRVS